MARGDKKQKWKRVTLPLEAELYEITKAHAWEDHVPMTLYIRRAVSAHNKRRLLATKKHEPSND